MASIKADLVNATKRLDGKKGLFLNSINLFKKLFLIFAASQIEFMNAELAYGKQLKGNPMKYQMESKSIKKYQN